MILSIITLNYKKSDLTISCIVSLHEQLGQEFKNGNIELIIVDNDSQDDSVKKIKAVIEKEKYPGTHLLANKENAGFGKGCNFGAQSAKGDYILFINNDTLVKDKAIMDMAQYLNDHQDIAILGGQLKNHDGSNQQSTDKFYTPFYAILLLLGMQRFGLSRESQNIHEVDWVKGGLFMIKKDVFEKLKGFDENIFMYIEDMELCFRAKKEGYKTFFYPNITVMHKDHGSSNRTFAIVNIYKNLLYFYKKHRSTGEYQLIRFMMQAKAVTLIAFGKILRNNYLIQTYEQALKAI